MDCELCELSHKEWTTQLKHKGFVSLVMKMNSIRQLQEKLENLIIGRKIYAGNLFDRFNGLDYLWDKCEGTTVLDIGCCEGLISYEFARQGSKLIHGFERDWPRVVFAKRLFRDVPIETQFVQANLAITAEEFEKQNDALLLNQYDFVLYLGVHHHLQRQMPDQALVALLKFLLSKARQWFVIRTNTLPEITVLIQQEGFVLVHSCQRANSVGMLHIYQRQTQ